MLGLYGLTVGILECMDNWFGMSELEIIQLVQMEGIGCISIQSCLTGLSL